MAWDGWEDETEASIARRTGVQRGVPERPGPPAARAEDEPTVDGYKLSDVKGAIVTPRKAKREAAHNDLSQRDEPGRRTNPKLDRGRRQGAKWFLVDRDRNILQWAFAQAHKVQGRKFQSGREAKRYVALLGAQDRGAIRHLRLQVNWPLYARRPDGLMEKVCDYRCDFVYEEREPLGDWVEVVEDAKGWKQDAYLLKSKWFAIQYGKEIRET